VLEQIFDTWRNNRESYDSAESAENDQWINDKRSAICNFSAKQNNDIKCNIRQLFLLTTTVLSLLNSRYSSSYHLLIIYQYLLHEPRNL